jgi:hypothetical protein
MKKFNLLLAAALVALTGLLSSCEDTSAIKGTVTYSLNRPNDISSRDGQIAFLDVFNVSVTYKNPKGVLITEEVTSLPWKFVQEVKAPFLATIAVDFTPKELENPPYEFPYTIISMASITLDSQGRRMVSGEPNYAGSLSSLYIYMDRILQAYGSTNQRLDFTEETLERHGRPVR